MICKRGCAYSGQGSARARADAAAFIHDAFAKLTSCTNEFHSEFREDTVDIAGLPLHRCSMHIELC